MDALLAEAGASHTVFRLAVVELHSVFAKKVRTGQIVRTAFENLTRRFWRDVRARRLHVVRLTAAHFDAAVDLIRRAGPGQNLRTLVALQLAVVLDLNEPAQRITFLCADAPSAHHNHEGCGDRFLLRPERSRAVCRGYVSRGGKRNIPSNRQIVQIRPLPSDRGTGAPSPRQRLRAQGGCRLEGPGVCRAPPARPTPEPPLARRSGPLPLRGRGSSDLEVGGLSLLR